MLRSMVGLKGYRVQAKDGQLGKVDDFFFDDEKWGVRYLVVDINIWLPGGRVLISPASFDNHPHWESRTFPVSLSRDEVRNSPDVNTHQPVSRQKEIEINYYYGWPNYWYVHSAQADVVPTAIPPAGQEEYVKRPGGDSHLRSVEEIVGYHIMALDGEIGHIDDIIVDDDDWLIRYMVVDVRKWLPGKRVLIATSWIREFDWGLSVVHVDLTKESVRNSPPYDPSAPVNRKEEEALYDYYGRPRYWL